MDRTIADGKVDLVIVVLHPIKISADNVFGIEAANKMIWFKINHEHYHFIKPFLVFLHYLPEDEMIEIGLDKVIVERLRNL